MIASISGLPPLRGRLVIESALGVLLDDTRIRLLEAIGRHGSIAKAVKAVPMSYKAAWSALDVMDDLTGMPLVERYVGGRDGGGTRLTAQGQRLVACYRAVERVAQDALDRIAGLDASTQGDAASAPDGRGTHGLRSSAGNCFAGTLARLERDAVGLLATVRLDAVTQVVAWLPENSAAVLLLEPGVAVWVLINAGAVLLGSGESPRTSAANQLWGRVSCIQQGPTVAEVILRSSSGLQFVALVDGGELERLGVRAGDPACAMFQAASVTLARCDERFVNQPTAMVVA